MIKIACSDESGDTGYTKKSTRYFIVSVIIVDNLNVLRRIVKDIHLFKKSKHRDSMLHAYKESEIVRNKLAKKLVI